MKYDPWVALLLESVNENTKNFPEAEKKYFRGLVQYEIDKGNQSEAEALDILITCINNSSVNVVELSQFIAKAFQYAGKVAFANIIKK